MSECLSGNDCQCAVDVSAIAWRNPSDHNSVELSIRTSSPAARQALHRLLQRVLHLIHLLVRHSPPLAASCLGETPNTHTGYSSTTYVVYRRGKEERHRIVTCRRTHCLLVTRASGLASETPPRGQPESSTAERHRLGRQQRFPRCNVKHTPVNRRPHDIDFFALPCCNVLRLTWIFSARIRVA